MPSPPLAFVDDALAALERSVRDREGDLRNVQLATVSPDGTPSLRTLVLRGFERSPPCAEVHSDARAAKVRDIAACDTVALLAWSAADHLQLRFTGTARLHREDELARARWDRLPPAARAPYGLLADAGTPIDDPASQPHLPDAQRFARFVVVRVALTGLDVLRPGPDGAQTRAAGRFTPAGIEAGWVGA